MISLVITIFALVSNFFVGIYHSKKVLLEGSKFSAFAAAANWFFVGVLSLVILKDALS